jgi:hypothetical protein
MALIEFILAAVTIVLAVAWFISQFGLSTRTSRDLVWRTALIVVTITPGLALVRGACLPWQWSIPVLPAARAGATAPNSDAAPSNTLSRRFSPADQATGETAVVSPNRPHYTRSSNSDRTGPGVEPGQIANAAGAAVRDFAVAPFHERGRGWLAILTPVWLAGFLFQCARISRAAWMPTA